MSRINKNFSEFGSDAQSMLIEQIQSIDLEKIGPKSIAHVGKTLIALIKQSHRFQEETDEESRDNWISIRELSHIILVDILKKYQELSDNGEIPEWERANVMNVLTEITKVCHEEERRDKLADDGTESQIDERTLEELLGH
jgi:hypothetical protein